MSKQKKICTKTASVLMCAMLAGTSVPVAPVFASESDVVSEQAAPVMEADADTKSATENTGENTGTDDAAQASETQDASVMPLDTAPEDDSKEPVAEGIHIFYNSAKTPVTVDKTASLRDVVSQLFTLAKISQDTASIYVDWVDGSGVRTKILAPEDGSSMTAADLYTLIAGQSGDLTLVVYTNTSEVIRFSAKTTSDADFLSVKRVCAPNLYKVTYDGNDEHSGPKDDSFVSVRAEGETISHFDVDVSWDRHTFLGWFDGMDVDANQITEDTVVTRDILLYARWQADTYLLSFDSQGGSPVESQMVAFDKTVTDFEKPTREGYTFLGWFDAPEGGNQVTSIVLDSADKTLYAHWEEVQPEVTTYVVTLDGQNGYSDVITMNKGTAFVDFPKLTRDGYDFLGWFDEKEGGSPISIYTGDEDATFYAQWKEKESEPEGPSAEKVVVTLDDQNGNIDTYTVDKNGVFTDFPTPVREGYEFLGWFDDAKEGSSFTSYTVSKDVTFYAHWQESSDGPDDPVLKTYVILLNDQNGTVKKYTVKEGVTFDKFAALTRDGYEFLGWFDAKEGGNQVTSYDVTADATFYAQWKEKESEPEDPSAEKVVVTLDDQNGNIDKYTVDKNSVFTDFPTPVREGYEFLGWFDDAEEGSSFTSYTVSKDVTFYAHWQKSSDGPEDPVLKTYVVLLNDQNGTVKKYTVKEGVTFDKFAALTRDGYEFLGWFDAKEGGNQVTSYDVTADATFYAQWKKVESDVTTYVVTLDDQNGNVNTYTVNTGDVFTDFAIPTRDGYTFLGWFDAKEGGNQVTSYDGDADVTFYAQWKADEKKVTKLSLNYHELTVKKNDPLGLKFTYGPTGAVNAKFVWTSSNPDVIAVVDSLDDAGNKKQTFKYMGAGKTVLTVATEDGSISDSCEITVTDDGTQNNNETPVPTPDDNNDPGNTNGNGSNETPTPTPTQPTLDDNTNTVKRLILTVISATGTTQSVTVNDDVKLSDLAAKLGYEVATYSVKQATVEEYKIDGSTTMRTLANLTSNGDLLIIGYGSDGKAIGSAKVVKTADDTFTVTMSKDTNVALNAADGTTVTSGDDTDADKGKGEGEQAVAEGGKSDAVAAQVKTADTMVMPLYGGIGALMTALLGFLAYFKKKRR